MSGPKRIYMVVWTDYDIFEIDSFWYSEEAAESRRKTLGSDYEVQSHDVADGNADAADQVLRIMSEPSRCNWREDEDGIWHADCRRAWTYDDGGSPSQHGDIFCGTCGRLVTAHPYRDTP